MKNGDIYIWRYTKEERKKRTDSINTGTLYWCCSNIAIFNRGYLVDTYWFGGENTRFDKEAVGNIIDIQFIANQEDLEPVTSPQYYEPCNIVDLRHANDSSKSNIYKRKGAMRDRETMMTLANAKRLDAVGALRDAKRDILRYEEVIDTILNSSDLNKEYV